MQQSHDEGKDSKADSSARSAVQRLEVAVMPPRLRWDDALRDNFLSLATDASMMRIVPFGRQVRDWPKIAARLSELCGIAINAQRCKSFFAELNRKAPDASVRRYEQQLERMAREHDIVVARVVARRSIERAKAEKRATDPHTPIAKQEAGVLSALHRGERPFRRAEDRRLLALARDCRVLEGPNRGRIDWIAILRYLGSEFTPVRTVASYQQRMRRLRKMG